jgi:hypothetical protein
MFQLLWVPDLPQQILTVVWWASWRIGAMDRSGLVSFGGEPCASPGIRGPLETPTRSRTKRPYNEPQRYFTRLVTHMDGATITRRDARQVRTASKASPMGVTELGVALVAAPSDTTLCTSAGFSSLLGPASSTLRCAQPQVAKLTKSC